MQISNLQPHTSRKSSKRVGRGGVRGKTSGRGHKGQGQHGSSRGRTNMRDLIKKLPKLRGYKFNSIQTKPTVVNLASIDAVFAADEKVNPTTLAEKGLISATESLKTVKILGTGDLSKKLEFDSCTVSASAAEKIKAANGIIN